MPVRSKRRLDQRFGDGRAVAGGMPAVECLDGKDGERDPDETEGDQMIVGERFVIKKNAQQKTSGWGKVLEETDGRHAKMPRGVSEPDERQTGHDTGADKNKRERSIRWTEDRCASALQN